MEGIPGHVQCGLQLRTTSAHHGYLKKRCTVIIAGKHAAYVRHPSEHEDQIIHRFATMGIEKDWLRDENKKFYSHYKEGVRTKYPGFDDKAEQEGLRASKLIATEEEKEYLRRGNTHDKWRAEAGPASPCAAPASPTSKISLKEELARPCRKSNGSRATLMWRMKNAAHYMRRATCVIQTHLQSSQTMKTCSMRT